MEAIVAGEWINGMCSSEEAEFMAELLGNCSLPNESANFMVSPSFNAEAAMYSSDETSFSGCTCFPFSSQEGYYSALSHHVSGTNADSLTTMDYCKDGFQDDSVDVMGGDDFLNRDERGLLVAPRNEKISSPSESRKRSRVPCHVPRSKKSMKCSKMDDNNNNNSNNNAVVIQSQSQSQSQSQRQTSSNYCSEDESNEMNYNNSCSTSKGKRASRGSATDPQSLYARKRRERINERLKVLQTLVPNGTKVDISTMLEEAVEYVKFLQLQIKLLSSDDLWMYSPIAYNGMDIGLDLRISTAAAQHSS